MYYRIRIIAAHLPRGPRGLQRQGHHVMGESVVVIPPGVARGTNLRARLGRRFFVAMAIAMLAVIALGFGPSLFFRPIFDPPEIPATLLLHGAVLTAWFVWFLVQSSLIAAGNTGLHRRMGIVGVAIGACVVAVSLLAIVPFVPRMREIGTDFETQGARLAAGQIGDSLTLVAFVAMVVLAVVWRRRPELHKRLMLFASLQILGPAGARTPATFAALGLGPVGAPGLIFVLLITGGPIAYDLLSRGRLHPVTIVCLPIQLGSVFLSFALAGNEAIRAFILGLH
jgi:hypothetical protein